VLRRIALALVLGSTGCSIDTEGIASDPNPLDDVLDTSGASETSSPGEDSTIADTVEDTTIESDTGTAMEIGGDTFAADTFMADTFVADTFVPDTFVPDTFMPDTFVPDTFVADTFVADTFVPDTFVDDTFVPDTFEADTFVPDTTVTDTGTDTGTDTAPTGILEVTRSELTGTARDLSFSGSDGILDWAHWGYGSATGWNHRALGGTLITQGTASPAANHYTFFPTTVSWIGGLPTATVTDTRHGIYQDDSSESFTFDAQGVNTADRTLRVYTTWDTGGSGGFGATVNVSLSDMSATAYNQSAITPTSFGGAHVIVYAIRFRPLSATGKVVFKYTQTSSWGYIGLVGANLR
jgi:hypothetical protein